MNGKKNSPNIDTKKLYAYVSLCRTSPFYPLAT